MYNDSTSWLVHGRSAHLRASVRLALGTSPRQQRQKRLAEGFWSFFCSELRRLSLRSLRGGSLYHELLAARTLLELSIQLFRLVV